MKINIYTVFVKNSIQGYAVQRKLQRMGFKFHRLNQPTEQTFYLENTFIQAHIVAGQRIIESNKGLKITENEFVVDYDMFMKM